MLNVKRLKSTTLAFSTLTALVWLSACAGHHSHQTEHSHDHARATPAMIAGFDPNFDGKWAGDAICYGPHRDGQTPNGGPHPTKEQVAEDARIMAKHWRFVRMYGTGDATEALLQTIRDEKLPLKLFMGLWITPEAVVQDGVVQPVNEENARLNAVQIAEGIRLANTYKDQIAAIGVGNETQVFWSTYRTQTSELIRHIQAVKHNVSQPVTTCDSYEFWLTPESQLVAKEVDFAAVHVYAMWNKQQLDGALQWSREKLSEVQAKHPSMQFVMTELGWATDRGTEGYQAEGIVGVHGEKAQEMFFRTWRDYAVRKQIPYFWFQAFDEKWKGGSQPDEVEKHWGVFFSDRKPKLVMQNELVRK